MKKLLMVFAMMVVGPFTWAAAHPVMCEREVSLDKKYLLFPVTNVAKKDKKEIAVVLVDGVVVRKFDIATSDAPDWFAHLDVSPWQGKKAVVRIEQMSVRSKALDLVTTADTFWNANQTYHEPRRGQLHFSARRGWNNDPNGMVFDGELYNLYFQHNPYGWPWGNMHWGHAASRDMIHWLELPIAIYPRQYGDWVFSGSAVVDKNNTSGWKKETKNLIVAAFTSTVRGECIVYSNDRGRTFAEYAGNPVVKHKGRDPRLLWHEASQQWVMAIYDEFENKRYIAFYTSPDLKAWTFQSRIEGFYECPDLFELSLGDKKYWVLTAASSDYMIGEFDGKKFTPMTPQLKGHQGQGYYAAQTFSHEPRGRVIQIGWLQTATPGMPFNQSMSLPHELKLIAAAEGPRLTWSPIKEFQSLRTQSHRFGPFTIKPGDANPLVGVRGELLEVCAEFTPDKASTVVFTVRGQKITYDCLKQELVFGGHRASAPLCDGKQRISIVVDHTCYEILASDGLTYMPMVTAPQVGDQSVVLAVENGTAKFDALEIHELKSIWP